MDLFTIQWDHNKLGSYSKIKTRMTKSISREQIYVKLYNKISSQTKRTRKHEQLCSAQDIKMCALGEMP